MIVELLIASASVLTSLLGWLVGVRAKNLASQQNAHIASVGDTTTVGTAISATIGAVLLGPIGPAVGARVGAGLALPRDTQRVDPVIVVRARLSEAHEEIQRQLRLASTHRVASLLLTSAQFLVGGLLASSFVQQSLDKSVIGMLGLLVLTSSLVRQYYRPELEQAAARGRATRLRAVAREPEDSLLLRGS